MKTVRLTETFQALDFIQMFKTDFLKKSNIYYL